MEAFLSSTLAVAIAEIGDKTQLLALFLVRDARAKERKKYGLKRARKAPQYTKR